MPAFVPLAGAFALSVAATGLLRWYARRYALFDLPNDRSSHTEPTPRLGGIAITLAALVAWIALFAGRPPATEQLTLAAAALAIAVVGLIDDLRSISPPVKLLGEIAAASMLVAAWVPPLTLWSGAAVILWLLTYVNFFNFMDGSDGLAAGVAVLSTSGLGVLAAQAGAEGWLWPALAVAAATAGFLLFNLPRASMFMGDSGSLFLGYTIGALAVTVVLAGASVVAAGLVLSPFLVDAGFTLVARAARGEVVWRAHRSHLYQRLLKLGVSHGRVAIIYWSWTAASATVGCAWTRLMPELRPLAVLLSLAPAAAIAAFVRRRERAAAQAGGAAK